MTWSSPDALRVQVQRRWDRGELLQATVRPDVIVWPLRLTLRSPSTADLADRFEDVRVWIRTIAEMPYITVEWREWTHRVQGRQRVPAAVSVESLEAALAWVGKSRAAQQFQRLWQLTSQEQAALQPWLQKRPLQALALADRWYRLLAVVAWLHAHPRPGVYLRQVDAPGVDSKFIERHLGVLTDLLDLVLPAGSIDATATGASQFARRYGFLDKPTRIRFRLLDVTLPSLPGCAGLVDVTLDAVSFSALSLPVARVFITENETNFLAFPPVSGAIVVFGAGYGWEWLAAASWLHRCELHYWGDIDTHGFAILDQLRERFPHTESLLMDKQTLLTHQAHWDEEPGQAHHDLSRLTTEEAKVYDDLRWDRLRPKLRLEQERVQFGWLNERLRQLLL